MAGDKDAWVWSQYRGVTGGDDAASEPLPLFGSGSGGDPEALARKRLGWGAALTGAMITGLFFPKIAAIVLIVSVLMLISGVEPERFEQLCGMLPGGKAVLGLLAFVDGLLP